MRFIHTADWHLGRLFHGVHLTDDQAHVLAQLIEIVADTKPDAVIVAGDIYDRAVPPPEAVDLLDHVLSRLVVDLKVPVILIAGNHDSPGRLNFGSRLLAGRRLYVTGNLPPTCEPLILHDADGPVHFYALPFAEPSIVRSCLDCDDAIDHDTAMHELLNRIRQSHVTGERRVLIGHAFVAGGNGCESERPLSIGGAGTVDASRFHGFHYVALGHLHRPQSLSCGEGEPAIHYSGSILKYSFDEVAHPKHVYLVEMDGAGQCVKQTIHLKPRRDVRRITGLMADLLKGPTDGSSAEDYLEVVLDDEGAVMDPMPRLREVYPNVLHLRPKASATRTASDRPDIGVTSDVDLFKSFFQHVTGEPLKSDHQAAFVSTIDAMHSAQREAPAGDDA
jgi:exonuclease SbcD